MGGHNVKAPKFSCMSWATAAILVVSYGPLRGMKPYSKNCDDFHTVGQSTGFLKLCAKGHSTGFGSAPWTIAQDLFDSALYCRSYES